MCVILKGAWKTLCRKLVKGSAIALGHDGPYGKEAKEDGRKRGPSRGKGCRI